MKKWLLLLVLSAALLLPTRLRAIDPVTIAVLTPVALKTAEVASPYVFRGLASGGQQLLGMAENMAELFLIPWGMGQTLALDPGSGVGNIVQGCTAPFKLAWNALTLPLAFCGVAAGF